MATSKLKEIKIDRFREDIREFIEVTQTRQFNGQRQVFVVCPDCKKGRFKYVTHLLVSSSSTYCTDCSHKLQSIIFKRDTSLITNGGYITLKKFFIPEEDQWLIEGSARTDGLIFQHRYIMAKKLNRPLKDDEVVRHMNGIKNDNRPENLVVGSHLDNMRDHGSARIAAMYWENRSRVLESKLSSFGINIEDLLANYQIEEEPKYE